MRYHICSACNRRRCTLETQDYLLVHVPEVANVGDKRNPRDVTSLQELVEESMGVYEEEHKVRAEAGGHGSREYSRAEKVVRSFQCHVDRKLHCEYCRVSKACCVAVLMA